MTRGGRRKEEAGRWEKGEGRRRKSNNPNLNAMMGNMLTSILVSPKFRHKFPKKTAANSPQQSLHTFSSLYCPHQFSDINSFDTHKSTNTNSSCKTHNFNFPWINKDYLAFPVASIGQVGAPCATDSMLFSQEMRIDTRMPGQGPQHSASRHQAGISTKNQELRNNNGPKTNRSLSKAPA